MLIEDALKSLGFELNGFLLVTCKRLWVGPAICQRIQISVKNGNFTARCFWKLCCQVYIFAYLVKCSYCWSYTFQNGWAKQNQIFWAYFTCYVIRFIRHVASLDQWTKSICLWAQWIPKLISRRISHTNNINQPSFLFQELSARGVSYRVVTTLSQNSRNTHRIAQDLVHQSNSNFLFKVYTYTWTLCASEGSFNLMNMLLWHQTAYVPFAIVINNFL